MKFLKHIFLVFVLSFILIFSKAQSYDSISLKEDFDFYSELLVFDTYNLCSLDPNKDWNIFGDGISKIIDGYIDMYLTTKDKAYLYKFIHQSLCIVRNRNDIHPEAIAKTPKWTETEMSTYTDGYVLGVFSRFIFLVKIDQPELMQMPLYQFDEIIPDKFQQYTCNCNFTGIKFETLGEYVNWLEKRTRETLDYFVYGGLWSDETGMLQPSGTLVVNMQIGFARSLLYLGLCTDNSEYLAMADTIAKLFKKTVKINDPCTKQKYSAPAFIYDSTKNSYWWYHYGWTVSKRECLRSAFIKVGNYNTFTEFVEDASHGAMVMIFPFEHYKYRQNIAFNSNDMLRFRNTFVNNVYNNGNYKMSVDGSDRKNYLDTKYNKTDLAALTANLALYYSEWAEFDYLSQDTTNTVYKITFNDYLNQYYNKNQRLSQYRGQTCYGHAKLINQQWKKENFSLTIFNRDMVYDQDFYAPANIVINPKYKRNTSATSIKPFAHPKDFLDNEKNINRFVIEQDVEVNLRAGNSISLKQGFYVKKGAKFSAKIIQSEKHSEL